MPELTVDRTAFLVDCRCDLFPGCDLGFGPDSWAVAAAGGVLCNDGRFADDKCARDTCSLFVVLCGIVSDAAWMP
jgi:hypothetical protein